VVVNASSQQIVVELLYWFLYRYLCKSCYRGPLPNSTVFWNVITTSTMCISVSLSPPPLTHTRMHTNRNSTTTSKAWTKNHSKVLRIYQLFCIYTIIFSNTTILSDTPQLWIQTSKAVAETPHKTEHTLRAMTNRKHMMEAYDETTVTFSRCKHQMLE